MQWWTATGALEGLGQRVGLRDVDAPAVDEGVLRAAARPGEQAYVVAGVGELAGDGRADRAGSGDDVDGAHGISR